MAGVEEEVRKEHERSEALLGNILPGSVIERLKSGEPGVSDGFEEATVLFADIEGFTVLSNRVSPAELVELLARYLFPDAEGSQPR